MSDTPAVKSKKARIHATLDNQSHNTVGWVIEVFFIVLIVANVLIVILETVQGINLQFSKLFWTIEIVSLGVFTVEYCLRLWCCTAEDRYSAPIKGRILYIITPLALIDLAAILPTYLSLLFLPIGVDFLFLRALRLFRVLRVFKLGHYSDSLATIKRVVAVKSGELFIVAFTAVIVLIVASSAMYYVEFASHSSTFTSIPDAMWWGVETLTTVGYGDMVPVTPVGKAMGAVIAVMGIALFALPAGILGSGFYEEFQKRREKDAPASQSQFLCTSIADEIKKAAELRDSGIITLLEFEDYKKQLLRSVEATQYGNLESDRSN